MTKLETRRRRGLSGRTFWITGPSESGKTTIARLIANEVAPDWPATEYDTPRDLLAADIRRIKQDYQLRPLGNQCVIVNEAHLLNKDQIEELGRLRRKQRQANQDNEGRGGRGEGRGDRDGRGRGQGRRGRGRDDD